MMLIVNDIQISNILYQKKKTLPFFLVKKCEKLPLLFSAKNTNTLDLKCTGRLNEPMTNDWVTNL